jgi:hypothetical protein
MATTTPNYGWDVPTSTDYVKDGATAIENLGDDIDATLWTALGGAYPGLRLVKKQTIGSGVSSVAVTGAFSATYENYKIVVSGGASSTATLCNLQLGSSTTNYLSSLFLVTYSTAGTGAASSTSSTSFLWAGNADPSGLSFSLDLTNPFLTKQTSYYANVATTSQAGFAHGIQNASTSYTDFTIIPQSGTLTGGTIYVYGYGAS